jgi:hypothetical protein
LPKVDFKLDQAGVRAHILKAPWMDGVLQSYYRTANSKPLEEPVFTGKLRKRAGKPREKEPTQPTLEAAKKMIHGTPAQRAAARWMFSRLKP